MVVDVVWDINLRANLRLWPEPLPHVRSLAAAIGSKWDEAEIATNFFDAPPGEDRRRAVRQTYEAMAYEGLVHRTDVGTLEATRLGRFVLSFLGLSGDRKFISDANRSIVAGPMIYGLSILTEVRVIWSLMRMLDDRMTNEELNRAMARIVSTDDVASTAVAIQAARQAGDVTTIGRRLYDDAGFGTASESGQRKAMNPHFLLAGGGGLFISVDAGERRLHQSVIRQIDGALRSKPRQIHAGTESQIVQAIARASMAPRYQSEDT